MFEPVHFQVSSFGPTKEVFAALLIQAKQFTVTLLVALRVLISMLPGFGLAAHVSLYHYTFAIRDSLDPVELRQTLGISARISA